jgi:hypothetical protein
MFEEFSPRFESAFRIFFIIWVCFWGFINIVNLLYTYAVFDSSSNNDLIGWFIQVVGQVITITLGVFLLFIMANVPARIKKAKKISNTALITTMAVAYYLIANILNIGSVLVTDPENSARNLVFQTAWLLPSIVLLIIHVIYVNNLGAYNESLESKSK